jgi:hypothetical protein
MVNKLGEYLYKRISKDQESFSTTRPRTHYGLYINSKDLQRYVWDYFKIGIDEDGLECGDDIYETKINQPFDNYWDEKDPEI